MQACSARRSPQRTAAGSCAADISISRKRDRFVFAPPPLTSVVPSVGVQTAETLGPGMPSIGSWPTSPSSLPLLGADAVMHSGDATARAHRCVAARPARHERAPDDGFARVRSRGQRTLLVSACDLWSSGEPISTTTFFGSDQEIQPARKGASLRACSRIRTQTIAGGRAFFHPLKGWDALAELGRAWYDAGLVADPGTSHYGNYEHFSLARHLGTMSRRSNTIVSTRPTRR